MLGKQYIYCKILHSICLFHFSAPQILATKYLILKQYSAELFCLEQLGKETFDVKTLYIMSLLHFIFYPKRLEREIFDILMVRRMFLSQIHWLVGELFLFNPLT